MTATEKLPLLEKRRIDHTVFVYSTGNGVRVKLLDDDEDGDFVDGSRIIQEMRRPGLYLIPLVGGNATPAPAEEVAYVLRHLPMTVERVDHSRSTSRVVKFYELLPPTFPEDDEHLVGLLKDGPFNADFGTEPWAATLQAAMASAAKHDVFGSTAGAKEHDVFASTDDDLFARV